MAAGRQSSSESQTAEPMIAVVAAVVGNAAIAAIKFVAAALTGSSAMIAEGIHSLVDTGNGGLLMLGMRKSRRPPDEDHPFGHSMELYFWSFIVAISVFGIGGGMSIYEGISHIRHPAHLKDPTINYVVLGAAMVFEIISWTVAYRQFRKTKAGRGIVRTVREGKDPTLFTVVFEDTAALLGLVIAFLGVFLSHQLNAPALDGAASVVIGSMLACTAVWLAAESKGLLLGEAADTVTVGSIRDLAQRDEAVQRAGRPLTMHFGPHDVLVNLEVEFVDELPAEQIHAAIHRIERRIHGKHPEVTRIYIEVESVAKPAAGPSSADSVGAGEPTDA